MPQALVAASMQAGSAVVVAAPGQAWPQAPQSVGCESAACDGSSLQPACGKLSQRSRNVGSGAPQVVNWPSKQVRTPLQVPAALVRVHGWVSPAAQPLPMASAQRFST